MTTKTYSPKASEIRRAWHVIDVADAIVGPAATEVARLLQGKHKPTYAPHLDSGDHVIVVNASRLVLTAQKAKEPRFRHTGYPGGIKRRTRGELLAAEPAEEFRRTVKGMLPKTRLGAQMLTKLRVYAGPDHRHQAQQPDPHYLPKRAYVDRSVPQQPIPVCDPLSHAMVQFRTALAEDKRMTVLPIEGLNARGTRSESDDGGLLSVFVEDDTLVCSWSTGLADYNVAKALVRVADDRGEPCEVGVLTAGSFDWNVVEFKGGSFNTDLPKMMKGLMTGPDATVIRFETDAATWVWEARSPLNDGRSVRTFGILVDVNDTSLVLPAFDATADEAAARLRTALTDVLRRLAK